MPFVRELRPQPTATPFSVQLLRLLVLAELMASLAGFFVPRMAKVVTLLLAKLLLARPPLALLMLVLLVVRFLRKQPLSLSLLAVLVLQRLLTALLLVVLIMMLLEHL